MEIKIPKTVNDLRIKHFKALSNPDYEDITEVEMICNFLSEFSGVEVDLIKTIDYNDIVKMYAHATKLYSQIKLEKPESHLTFGGLEYSLVNPEKVAIGWHIDFSKCDIKEDPYRLACLFYYPTGVKYGAKCANSNLLHPIKERIDVITNEMTLQTFINASAFFLLKTEKSMKTYMESRQGKKPMPSLLQVLSGRM